MADIETDFLSGIFDDNFEKVSKGTNLGSTTSVSSKSSFTPAQSKNLDPLAEAVDRTSLAPKQTLEDTPSDNPSLDTVKAARAGVMAAQFITDIMNAQSAYNQTTSAVQRNLLLSKVNEEDTYFRGRQKALEEVTRGNLNADQVSASLAAQGIDLNSTGAQNTIAGYKSMGAYNAMRQEMNMFREAFKYDVEQIQLELQSDIAYRNRNQAMLGSLTNLAASAAMASLPVNKG